MIIYSHVIKNWHEVNAPSTLLGASNTTSYPRQLHSLYLSGEVYSFRIQGSNPASEKIVRESIK